MSEIKHLSPNMIKALQGIGFTLKQIRGMSKKRAMAHITTDLGCRDKAANEISLNEETGQLVARYRVKA